MAGKLSFCLHTLKEEVTSRREKARLFAFGGYIAFPESCAVTQGDTVVQILSNGTTFVFLSRFLTEGKEAEGSRVCFASNSHIILFFIIWQSMPLIYVYNLNMPLFSTTRSSYFLRQKTCSLIAENHRVRLKDGSFFHRTYET